MKIKKSELAERVQKAKGNAMLLGLFTGACYGAIIGHEILKEREEKALEHSGDRSRLFSLERNLEGTKDVVVVLAEHQGLSLEDLEKELNERRTRAMKERVNATS